MSTNGTGDDSHDDELSSFEHNRWFYGKMVTPRDLGAEWGYHAHRLNTLARYIIGEGIVFGLDTTVAPGDPQTGELEVTVEPGLALDCVGRQVVVERQTPRTIPPVTDGINTGTADQPVIHLYLTYDECVKESVPLSGFATDRTSDDDATCEYNRVLETFDVEYGNPPPTEYKQPESLARPVDFRDGDPLRMQLAMVQSFYDPDALPDTCADHLATFDTTEPPVFLGSFERTNGVWQRVSDVSESDRRFVYTNDMLYAAITSHATDFENPHDVTAVDLGALQSINGVSGDDGDPNNLTLTSDTNSVQFTESDSQISLDVPEIPDVQRIEADVLARSLGHAIRAFDHVADDLGIPAARPLATRVRDAFDNRVHDADETYLGVFGTEAGTINTLAGEVSDQLEAESVSGFMRFGRARDELDGAVTAPAPTSLGVAGALLRLCEVADGLRPLQSIHFADFPPGETENYPLNDVVVPDVNVVLSTGGTDPVTFRDEWPPDGGDGYSELPLPAAGVIVDIPPSEYVEVEVVVGHRVRATVNNDQGTRVQTPVGAEQDLKHTLVFEGLSDLAETIEIRPDAVGGEVTSSLLQVAFRPSP